MSNHNVTRFSRTRLSLMQQRNVDGKGIHKQSESERAPNRKEVMGPILIQVSSATLQDWVTFF